MDWLDEVPEWHTSNELGVRAMSTGQAIEFVGTEGTALLPAEV